MIHFDFFFFEGGGLEPGTPRKYALYTCIILYIVTNNDSYYYDNDLFNFSVKYMRFVTITYSSHGLFGKTYFYLFFLFQYLNF